MKTIKLLTLALFFITFISCDDDNDIQLIEVTAETYTNLDATFEGGRDQMTGILHPVTGDFGKFNFATGATTTSTTDWDIAFRGTDIIINGGVSFGATDEPTRTGIGAAYIANMPIADVTEVDLTLLAQDSATGYVITSDWYTYNGATMILSANAGITLVIKTHDGNYAKVQILSYYKDNPASPNAFTDEERYYTFNYVYQPNEGVTTF